MNRPGAVHGYEGEDREVGEDGVDVRLVHGSVAGQDLGQGRA